MSNKGSADESLQSKLLYYSFSAQKLSGLFPFQKKRYMLPGIFYMFVHLIAIGLVVRQMAYNLNSIETMMLGFDGFLAHILNAGKCLPLLLHRQQIKVLINDLPKFSSTKNADDYKFWIKISKLFILLYVLAGIAFILYPGFLFQYYIPNLPHMPTILLIIHKIQFTYAVIALMGNDLFYLALFAIIKVQYQTLKADLELLETSENKYESLRLWIKQHVVLTKFTKYFVSTFSEASLLQYIVVAVNLCTELYFFSERETDGLFLTTIYIIVLFVQVCLICLTADEITTRALDLADALYSIEWYNFPQEEMKVLPLLIQQTQVPMRFLAGGLINIDKRAMTAMLQNTYTFYTLARKMKQN